MILTVEIIRCGENDCNQVFCVFSRCAVILGFDDDLAVTLAFAALYEFITTIYTT